MKDFTNSIPNTDESCQIMSCNKHAAPPLFTCLEVPVLDLESSELNSVNSITGTSGMATNSNPIAINLRESALDYTAIPSTSKAR